MTETNLTEPGNYTGKIIVARLETRRGSDDLDMAFDIQLDNGEHVTAKHATAGEWGHIGQAVCEEVLELKGDWPTCLHNLEDAIGQDVPVKVKHNVSKGKTYANAYIQTPGSSEPASEEQIAAAVARLSGKNDDKSDIPF